MSGDAIDLVRDAQLKGRQWDDLRREMQIVETQLATHGLAMQNAGHIVMYTDSEWIFQSLENIDLESLR